MDTNASNKTQEFAARLQTLKDAYLARLSEELGQLKIFAAELAENPEAAEPLTQLHYRLHKLAGSAGSFGFPELGKQARLLELQTLQWSQGSVVDAAGLELFSAGIASLEGLVNVGKAN